jgi:adenosylhomocysteinase
LAKKLDSLESLVYDVPAHIDRRVSEYALNAFGINLEYSPDRSSFSI